MGALDWLGVRRGAGNGNGDEDRIREGGRGQRKLEALLTPCPPVPDWLHAMHACIVQV